MHSLIRIDFGDYSVAQHACLVVKLVEMLGGTFPQQLAALHHDDAEIVLGDVPSPMKEALRIMEGAQTSSWDRIEKRHNRAIEARYYVDLEDPVIKRADTIILAWEIRRIVPYTDRPHFGELPQHETDPESGRRVFIDRDVLVPWEAHEAEERYMSLHEQLTYALSRSATEEENENAS